MADYIEDVKDCFNKLELSTSACLDALTELYSALKLADVTHRADYVDKDTTAVKIYQVSSSEKVFTSSQLSKAITKINTAGTARTAAFERVKEFRKKYKDNYAIDFKSSAPPKLPEQFICIQDKEQ